MRAFLLVGIFLAAGCRQPSSDPAYERGRQTYMGTCIACHNINPAIAGAIGPEIQGASKELLEERIVRAAYPAGYKAKRDTKLMPAQPQLAGTVADLAVFLNAKPQ